MIVDELILKLKADLSDVEKRLKEVEGKASAAGKNAGAEMGKTMGTSFGDVFNAIAGAAVLNTVKNFYSRAAAEFNKFEASFLRVDSIAKGFGRSVDVARKNVDELAQKGFLNLNQAASSYADAIALGFDEKQARKFIDALSDVSAFQNTIGDGAAAVQSGLSGLLSNSAEKVENIGVPIKVLNMAYNENIKTMGKAAALQKFYAGVLKESEKFSGDAARAVDTLAGAQNKANAATDKAMVAIGKGLEPILKRLYNTIEDGMSWIAGLFSGLNQGTKTIVLIIPIISALVIALGSLIPVLKAISLANPFGWVAIAIAAIGSLIAAINQLYGQKSITDLSERFKKSREEAIKLGETAQKLSEINKRTAQEELTLIDTKEALRKKAKELGLDYDKLAASAKSYLDISKQLAEKEKLNAKADISGRLVNSIRQAGNIESGISSREKIIRQLEASGNTAEAASQKKYLLQDKRDLEREQANARAINEQLDRFGEDTPSKGGAAGDSAGKGSGKLIEQRFLEASNKIAEIEKNREQTLRKYRKALKDEDAEEERQRRIKAANEDADLQIQAELNARRQAYAEFIEDKYMADTEALKKSTDDAIRASNEILEAELKNKKLNEAEILDLQADNEIRIQKIREANARKQAEINAQSFAETINAATSIATIARATQSKDAAGLLTGAGGGLSALSKNKSIEALNIPGMGALGTIGIVGAAIGGLGAVIGSIFNSSDDKREREAAKAQQQREEAKKLLELQNEYTKSQLELQRAAAETPFKNLEKELRLITLKSQTAQLNGTDRTTAENAARSESLSAIAATVATEGGTIAQGQLFGNVQATAGGLTSFLKERQTQAIAVQQFMALFEQIGSSTLSPGQYWSISEQMKTYKGLIPDAIYDSAFATGPYSDGGAWQGGLRSEWADGVNTQTILGNAGKLNVTRGLVNEVGIDTGRAEQLLALFERQNGLLLETADNTKKTAENTAKALELRPDRERSFIDVGQGFIQSLGQRITSPSAIGIARSVSQNLTIPTELGAANVITGRARTLQERMADALETQIKQGATANDILRDIRAAAVELLAVMDGNPNTGASMTMNDFVSLQSEANRRRV